jgi:hypothetical protein
MTPAGIIDADTAFIGGVDEALQALFSGKRTG